MNNNLQNPSLQNPNVIKKNIKYNYLKVLVNMFVMFILIIASINWTLSAYNYNIVQNINNFINKIFKSNYPIDKGIYIFISIIGIYIAFKRDTWLPFLSETVLPDILIPLKVPTTYNKTITIQTEPNSKIIYWAALPHDNIPDVSTAYEDYSNSGCVLSNNLGEAKLFIIEGSEYSVPFNSHLKKHVHYRIFNNNNNLLSKVHTIYY
jgi:hypothetical protein